MDPLAVGIYGIICFVNLALVLLKSLHFIVDLMKKLS